MATHSLAGVLGYVRSLVGFPQADRLSDAALLRRFADVRDETALVSLLQRHGPLVLLVCRQVLADPHAAEDAFQATFLVLAKHAASIRQRESLAAWLHRVAYRAALKVKTRAVRRQLHEQEAAAMRSTDEQAATTDWQPVLHAEVDRLPAKYRAPVVLCYLQGRSHVEAAVELGWPLGTVNGRIARARDLLQRRLVRRGVTLSACGLTIAGSEAAAAVPAALAEATVHAAMDFTAGGAATAFSAVLARSLLGDLLWVRVKLGAALILLTCIVGASATAWLQRTAGQAATLAANEPDAAPPGVPQGPPPRTDALGDALPPGALARMGTLRLQHSYPFAALAFSPDGKLLATPGYGAAVHIWEVATGGEVRRLQGHQMSVEAVAFAPDGKRLATASGDQTVRLWDAATGQEQRRLVGHDKRVRCVAFSPDGRLVVSSSDDDTVRLWDVASGKELRQVPALQDVRSNRNSSLAFSPDGKLLVVGGGTGKTIHLWDVATAQQVRSMTGSLKQYPSHLGFSPDGKTLAASDTGKLWLWDVATGQELRSLAANRSEAHVGFTREGLTFVSRAKGLCLCNPATGEEVRCLPNVGSFFNLSPDGRTLASIYLHRIILRDVATGEHLLSLPGHRDGIAALALSADGKQLATAGRDSALWVWDLATGRMVREQREPNGVGLVLGTSDGRFLYSRTYGDQNHHLYDAASGQVVRTFGDAKDALGVAAVSPDGKVLATAVRNHGGLIQLWDLATGKPLRRIGQAERMEGWVGIECLAFSPDGKTVATSVMAFSTRIRIWDVATGQERFVLTEPNADDAQMIGRPVLGARSLAFSPEGQLLASASNGGQFWLWDMATGKAAAPLDPTASQDYAGSCCIAFAPDGKTVALAGRSADHAIRVWEIATRQQRGRLIGHVAAVTALAFSPDGRLISGSDDGTALVWDPLGRPKHAPLAAKELAGAADQLSATDAGRACAAMGRLATTGPAAVTLLGERLRPVVAPDAPALAQRIADLDSRDFAVRQAATEALANVGELAEPALRSRLAERPSLEVRQRLEGLLAKIQSGPPSAEQLGALRAVEVLEQIGTAEARQLLEKLAQGAEGGRLTREAKASLQRLAKRPATP